MFKTKVKIKRECPRCGYSLEALPEEGVCPECGRTYNSKLFRNIARYRSGNRWLVCFMIACPVAAFIGLDLPELIGVKFYNSIFGMLALLVFALLPVLCFGIGFALPIFVAYSRYLRAGLLYGSHDRIVVKSANVGACAGITLSYVIWLVLFSVTRNLNLYVFYIMAPGSAILATYFGSNFGERIGLRYSRSGG